MPCSPSHRQPKKNPFSMPSLLTPDPSALSAQSLVLHGRTLDVVRAVTRDEAGRLKEVGEKAREKADKRNMYLLREGGERLLDFCLVFCSGLLIWVVAFLFIRLFMGARLAGLSIVCILLASIPR